MQPKPLKVTISIDAREMEAAIAKLSGLFLRANRTSCKVAQDPTNFNLAALCTPLLDDWKIGKIPFEPGNIDLTFIGGKLSQVPDVLVYRPKQGDRLIYAGRATGPSPQQLPIQGLGPGIDKDGEPLSQLLHPLQTVTDVLTEMTAHQRAVESRLHQLLSQWHSHPSSPGTTLNLEALQRAIATALADQASLFAKQLQTALDAQTATFAQILSSQLTSSALHFNKRLDALQNQLEQLAAQVQELGELSASDALPLPQTEADWLKLIKTTWGTVGDYEQYSFSHRATNAETPLCPVPDWVFLCELDWVRKLFPTLSFLYDLIHGDSGIGYAGADILQQFGRHIDPQTQDPYYIYHQGGFTAYDALWQTANDPQHSWLPELQRLCSRISTRHQDIFQLFGWEPEAIASLERVVKRATYERQSGRQSTYESYPPPKTEPTISDYLAILNLGPFTPISLEMIKRAYKQTMKTAHPDTGGSKEHAQKINEAYEAVLKHYFPDKQ